MPKTYADTPREAVGSNDSDVLVVQQISSGEDYSLDQMKKTTIGTIRQPLYDRLEKLEVYGRFLAMWNSSVGLPKDDTFAYGGIYNYKVGDYYVVSSDVGTVNYRPDTDTYIHLQSSTTLETNKIAENDFYIYTNVGWELIHHGGASSFAELEGEPTDNVKLSKYLALQINESGQICIDC